MYHESHDLKMSMDSSRYDHKCQKCGITDENIDGLRAPCKAAIGKPEGLEEDVPTIKRMNLGRLYEQYIGVGGRDPRFPPVTNSGDNRMSATNTIPPKREITGMTHESNTKGPRRYLDTRIGSPRVNLFAEHGSELGEIIEFLEHEEHQYLTMLERILDEGTFKGDRTGVGCYSVRGGMMTFDLTGGKIPLLTTKQMGIKSIVAELLWFLEGSTDNKRLNELGATIWDEWALEDGDLGPIYGKQWVAWEALDKARLNDLINEVRDALEADSVLSSDPTEALDKLQALVNNPPKVNQIQELVTSLKENPNSRRMLVTAWNPAVLPSDYRWEYWLNPIHASGPGEDGMESMTLDQRMDWLWRYKGIGHGIFDEDILEQHAAPTHRRKVKVTPQDNVTMGRAALPACHTMFQVHTRELTLEDRQELTLQYPEVAERYVARVKELIPLDGECLPSQEYVERKDEIHQALGQWLNGHNIPRHALTLQFYCRSQDTPLGTPYNIASYGILAQMLAQCAGMVAEELIWMGGDVHIYSNQLEGVKVQLEREPYPFPTLKLNPEKKDIFGFTIEDFELIDYQHHPKIDFGDIAV